MIAAMASTIQARMSVQREVAHRMLAEDSAAAQSRTADQLERVIKAVE